MLLQLILYNWLYWEKAGSLLMCLAVFLHCLYNLLWQWAQLTSDLIPPKPKMSYSFTDVCCSLYIHIVHICITHIMWSKYVYIWDRTNKVERNALHVCFLEIHCLLAHELETDYWQHKLHVTNILLALKRNYKYYIGPC